MNCIVAGCRYINKFEHVVDAIQLSGFEIDTIVSGGASGIDTLAVRWAREYRKNIRVFNAQWDKHGKAAGPIRNEEMAQYANGLIAIWDGRSRGTHDMIKKATKHNLKTYIHRVDQNWWISSNKMTFSVATVDNVIIDAAPIARKFIGRHLVKLLKWMKKQGGLKVEQLNKKDQNDSEKIQ